MKENDFKNQQLVDNYERQTDSVEVENKLSTKIILVGIVLVTLLSLAAIYMLSKYNKTKPTQPNPVIVDNTQNVKTTLDMNKAKVNNVNELKNVEDNKFHPPFLYPYSSDKKFTSVFDLKLQQLETIQDKSDKMISWCINGTSVKDINEKCPIPSKIEMDKDTKLSDDFFNYLKFIDTQTQVTKVNKIAKQPKVLAKNIYLFLNIRDNPNKYQSKDEVVDDIYKNIQNQPVVTVVQANNYIESLKVALSTTRNMNTNTNVGISNSTYNPPVVYNNPVTNNMEQLAPQGMNMQDENMGYNQEEMIESGPSLVMTKTRKTKDN